MSLSSNYVIENKLENLIPVINSGLKGKSGIEVALLYKILPCKEIDSCVLVKKAYQLYYGAHIPDCSDTIFNAFIPFKDFCVAKLLILKNKNNCYNPLKSDGKYRENLNELIYLYLDDIFKGYEELRNLFDRYFDLMYSFSNFMPVPRYFNGSTGKNGKGDWYLNKDYPYLYLKNLEEGIPSIYNREANKEWLETNMEKYRVKDMYSLKPPYNIKEHYGYNDSKLALLSEFITEAIRLIEERFKDE